jgi:hypothetical protein
VTALTMHGLGPRHRFGGLAPRFVVGRARAEHQALGTVTGGACISSQEGR